MSYAFLLTRGGNPDGGHRGSVSPTSLKKKREYRSVSTLHHRSKSLRRGKGKEEADRDDDSFSTCGSAAREGGKKEGKKGRGTLF